MNKGVLSLSNSLVRRLVDLSKGGSERSPLYLRGCPQERVWTVFDFPSVTGMSSAKIEVIPQGNGVEVCSHDWSEHRVRLYFQNPDHIEHLLRSGNEREIDSLINATAWYGSEWVEVDLNLVSFTDDLFSRIGNVIETHVLKDKKVGVIGVGSVGSRAALQLAQAGVGTISPMDHGRVNAHNLCRQVWVLQDLGRLKVYAMGDHLKSKNPYLEVQSIPEKVTWDNFDDVCEFIRGVDLCLCLLDTDEGRQIVNRAAFEEKKTVIMGGFGVRASSGRVLRIRPGEGPCYQCYLEMNPGAPRDQEVSKPNQEGIPAYADHPAPVEPGLATWIEPLPTFISLLAIQELLQGTQTTLRNLDEDLSAHLYLWINRRDPQTQFTRLEPLSAGLRGLQIQQWCALPLEKDPYCQVCGDHQKGLLIKHGVTAEDNSGASSDDGSGKNR